MSQVSKPEEIKAEVTECTCGSKLFLNWGFQIAYTPKSWAVTTFIQESEFKNKTKLEWLHICAHCKNPYIMEENELVDVSELVSSEEVMAGLATLQGAPIGGKAAIIDP